MLGYHCQLVIIIVPIEELLDRIAAQISQVLLKLGVIEIFPFFVDVSGVEIVLQGRDERSVDLLVMKLLEGEALKPWMVLDLSCSVVAKSVLWLSLDHFVDEIGCFDTPASGDVSLLNLDLL